MKIVSLNGPAVIAGAVRYPIEGALTVTDAEAKRLDDNGQLDGEPEDVPVAGEAEAEEEVDDLDDKKVADLKSVAEREMIDLGNATNKADIVAAIRAARASQQEA